MSNIVPVPELDNKISIVDARRFEYIEEVARLRMEGQTEAAISKKLGIPRKEVKAMYEDWTTMIIHDAQSKDLAREHLYRMVEHYDSIVKRSYDLLAELEQEQFTHQISAQRNTTLKNIAEFEAKRLDFLQKAGLLDFNEIGNEMAAMEEKAAILIDILKTSLCSACSATVMQRLSEVTNSVEGVVVD